MDAPPHLYYVVYLADIYHYMHPNMSSLRQYRQSGVSFQILFKSVVYHNTATEVLNQTKQRYASLLPNAVVSAYCRAYCPIHRTHLMFTRYTVVPPGCTYASPVYDDAFQDVLLQETAPEVPTPEDRQGWLTQAESNLQALRMTPIAPPSQRKTKRPRKIHVGKPANHLRRWTPVEVTDLESAIKDKTITVELLQSIAATHQRTFCAIQGKLFSLNHITREESIALSDQLKAQTPVDAVATPPTTPPANMLSTADTLPSEVSV
jgi:hypothetical protein